MIIKRDKRYARSDRARRTRRHIAELNTHRLSVHRTPRHIYAQIISPDGCSTLASASTMDTEVRSQIATSYGNCAAAMIVGRIIAERARVAGVERVAFDRSGFKYHGRIQALAEAARESGLQF